MSSQKAEIVFWTCPKGHHTQKEPQFTNSYRNIKYFKCEVCNKSYPKNKWHEEIFMIEDPNMINLSYTQLKKRGVKIE